MSKNKSILFSHKAYLQWKKNINSNLSQKKKRIFCNSFLVLDIILDLMNLSDYSHVFLQVGEIKIFQC